MKAFLVVQPFHLKHAKFYLLQGPGGDYLGRFNRWIDSEDLTILETSVNGRAVSVFVPEFKEHESLVVSVRLNCWGKLVTFQNFGTTSRVQHARRIILMENRSIHTVGKL